MDHVLQSHAPTSAKSVDKERVIRDKAADDASLMSSTDNALAFSSIEHRGHWSKRIQDKRLNPCQLFVHGFCWC